MELGRAGETPGRSWERGWQEAAAGMERPGTRARAQAQGPRTLKLRETERYRGQHAGAGYSEHLPKTFLTHTKSWLAVNASDTNLF